MTRTSFALTLTVLTLAACGAKAQFETSKYPPSPDLMARAEKGAIAAGCQKMPESKGSYVIFSCAKGIVMVDQMDKELSVTCDGYGKEECSALLDKFFTPAN